MTVRPRAGAYDVAIKAYSRLIEGGREIQTMSVGVPDRPGLVGARVVESRVQMRPGEVVSIELPRLGENSSGAFADAAFSITMRARQLR